MINYKKISFILSTLILSFLVGYLAFAWTDAPGVPTECSPSSHPGCSLPINESNISQTKEGGLVIKENLTAPKLFDFDNNEYYIDPANTGVAGVFAGNVGIRTTDPKTKLDVIGIIKIGYKDTICDTSIAGAIRYNSGKFEGCDGEEWRVVYKAPSPEEQARNEAQLYCEKHRGVSTLNEDVVYCDQYNNMWAPTRSGNYAWSTEIVDINAKYNISSGNCNDLPTDVLANLYPACNACATLNYAGLTGWQLPSHSGYVQEGICCWFGSQIWEYGHELCQDKRWGSNCDCNNPVGSCIPDWENISPFAFSYWSATQGNSTSAWFVWFNGGAALDSAKENPHAVRCFLGHW